MSSIRNVLLASLTFVGMSTACGPKTKAGPPSGTATPVDPATLDAEGPKAWASNVALLDAPVAGDAMGVTIHQLKNGLTVYISTDRSTPSISSWIAVRSGSRHDPANSTGLAHYLEHMLFKGSKSLGSLDFAKEKPHLDRIAKLYDELRAAVTDAEKTAILQKIDRETLASSQYSVPNEFDNLYASLGIDGVNAFTSDDQTVYIATVPSNQFTTWTKVEGDRFTNPQFRLFYPELESVYEEKNRSLDSPNSRISTAVAKAMFPNHPYGTQPTIGLTEHLKTPAFGDMVQYFETWYRPNNMAIVLAGDIDPQTALPALEAAFGGLAPKVLPQLPPSSLDKPTERQDIEVVAPGEQSVLLAWPTVSASHTDRVALEVMDLLIDNSATGLLNIELVLSQKLPNAGSYGYNMGEAGMWVLTGTARDGQSHEEVEKLLLGVVSKLKSGAFSQHDLDAIVINSEIAEKRKLESNGARVSMMADAFINGRDWSDVVKDNDRLKAVTREEVMRVANLYLTDAPVVAKRVRGDFKAAKVPKPSISAIKIDSNKESDYSKSIKALPVDALSPQWVEAGTSFIRSELPAGPLVSVANEQNDLFTLEYQFNIGSQREPLLCYALSLLERSGAGKHSPEELQKELYAMGSSIDFRCSPRRSSIVISGIDRKMEDSIALLQKWLASPVTVPGTLDKLYANEVSRRKDQMNEPSAISSALFQFAIAGRESPYLKVASNKVLSRAKRKKLLAMVAKLLSTKHRTSYFGPRATEDLSALIAIGSAHKPTKPIKPMRIAIPKKPTLLFVDQKVAQAQVRIAWPSPELPVQDAVKAAILNQYLGGGMGGLIFQEIREARGLAYSAWTFHTATSIQGDETALIAGLGTQADKTVEAVQTLMGLLSPLRVENGRFTTAINSLDAEFRKNRTPPRYRADVVYAWEDRGLSADPDKAEYEALHATEAGAVQAFSNARTSNAHVVTITGDSARIDLKALAKAIGIATIKTMKIEKLFGY